MLFKIDDVNYINTDKIINIEGHKIENVIKGFEELIKDRKTRNNQSELNNEIINGYEEKINECKRLLRQGCICESYDIFLENDCIRTISPDKFEELKEIMNE